MRMLAPSCRTGFELLQVNPGKEGVSTFGA
jgi:hypothetical protein